MPRKTADVLADEVHADMADAVSPSSPEQDISQKLDTIIWYLHVINRRDRARYYGGILHSLIALIPMLFFLWSAWYIYQNGEKLLTQIVGETVRQTTTMSTNGMENLLRNFMPQQQTPNEVIR